MPFDPNSTDSMFTKILTRLEAQDAILARIETRMDAGLAHLQAGVDKTNGRVNSLEKWRDVVTAKTALIASMLSAAVTAAFHFFVR